MTSLLRQIVAGPRAKHAETGLDLCYVTDNIIVTYVLAWWLFLFLGDGHFDWYKAANSRPVPL